MVQKIWEIFGKAEVDLFISKDNSHCQVIISIISYYSKDMDALAQDWPNHVLYAFPPIAMIPQVIRRIREHKHKVLLVAPLCSNQHWFSELSRLLTAASWPFLLRRDLLSQANRALWHPRPELWALHFWWELADLPESILNTISQEKSSIYETPLHSQMVCLGPPGAQPVVKTHFPVTYH